MKKKNKLINIEDLKLILHIDDETVADYIEKGMPNYYFEDVLYFNFEEVMDWVCSCIDLGFLNNKSRLILTEMNYFLEQKDFSFQGLLEKIQERIDEYGLSNHPARFLLQRLRNPSFFNFIRLVRTAFPGFTDKQILSYYLGMVYDYYKAAFEEVSPKDSLF